jgi:hypothetical protein
MPEQSAFARSLEIKRKSGQLQVITRGFRKIPLTGKVREATGNYPKRLQEPPLVAQAPAPGCEAWANL